MYIYLFSLIIGLHYLISVTSKKNCLTATTTDKRKQLNKILNISNTRNGSVFCFPVMNIQQKQWDDQKKNFEA